MIEIKGNLWNQPGKIVVITTNGTVRKDKEAVMGKGCALEAKSKYLDLSKLLGNNIIYKGNHVYPFYENVIGHPEIITFPVKHNWWEKADLKLIEQSCKELVELNKVISKGLESGESFYHEYVIPRPGCGNGGLDWRDVKPILEKYLVDDRFHIISF